MEPGKEGNKFTRGKFSDGRCVAQTREGRGRNDVGQASKCDNCLRAYSVQTTSTIKQWLEACVTQHINLHVVKPSATYTGLCRIPLQSRTSFVQRAAFHGSRSWTWRVSMTAPTTQSEKTAHHAYPVSWGYRRPVIACPLIQWACVSARFPCRHQHRQLESDVHIAMRGNCPILYCESNSRDKVSKWNWGGHFIVNGTNDIVLLALLST